MANRMSEHLATENLLGGYLRDRRTKLDPGALGFPSERRRTPGLRREEVAQRANISPTWYTWLEQGRGGAPSADVLDRIARALMLTDVEREHLFLLGLGRPPEARYRKDEGVTPRLQRVLDALDPIPAVIRTATWDVVAWSRAATVMLMDYGSLPPAQRNTTGKAWRGSYWARSGWTLPAREPRRRRSLSSTNSAGSVPSSKRCGATTMFAAPMARLSSTYATRSSARSRSNIRPFRSMAGQTSPWWSITPRRQRTPTASSR